MAILAVASTMLVAERSWAVTAPGAQQITIAKTPGTFYGWPANKGIWQWGNEILVAYTAGTFKYNGPDAHAIDGSKFDYVWLSRSTDGGLTWTQEKPLKNGKHFLSNPFYAAGSSEFPNQTVNDIDQTKAVPLNNSPKINFADPNFLMLNYNPGDDGGYAWTQYSYDKGKTWSARYELPRFNQPAILGRTDYIVKSNDEIQMFLITQRADAPKEGRVFSAKITSTATGGEVGTFQSFIGTVPTNGASIMPSTVLTSGNRLITALRVADGNPFATSHPTVEIHISDNGGSSWTKRSTPVTLNGRSTPGDLTLLPDGKIVLTYADRESSSILAKLSDDDGLTWTGAYVLRSGGGNFDIGYPRNTLRPDGQILTTYYWNDDPTKERYIAATLWNPGQVVVPEPAMLSLLATFSLLRRRRS